MIFENRCDKKLLHIFEQIINSIGIISILINYDENINFQFSDECISK